MKKPMRRKFAAGGSSRPSNATTAQVAQDIRDRDDADYKKGSWSIIQQANNMMNGSDPPPSPADRQSAKESQDRQTAIFDGSIRDTADKTRANLYKTYGVTPKAKGGKVTAKKAAPKKPAAPKVRGHGAETRGKTRGRFV